LCWQDAFLNRGFAFQSPAWLRCEMHEVMLTKGARSKRPELQDAAALTRLVRRAVFRQSDEEFVTILNDLREGRGHAALAALQQRCTRPLPCVHGINPTELYARNADVDAVNANELRRLDFPIEEFKASDSVVSAAQQDQEGSDAARGYTDRATDAKIRQQTEALQRHEFFRDCLAAPTVQLKMAAQVMLLRNLELSGGASRMLVNGSRGVVAHFLTSEEVKAKSRAEITAVRSSPHLLHAPFLFVACRRVHIRPAPAARRSRAAARRRATLRASHRRMPSVRCSAAWLAWRRVATRRCPSCSSATARVRGCACCVRSFACV
jgi:hypothetical protein